MMIEEPGSLRKIVDLGSKETAPSQIYRGPAKTSPRAELPFISISTDGLPHSHNTRHHITPLFPLSRRVALPLWAPLNSSKVASRLHSKRRPHWASARRPHRSRYHEGSATQPRRAICSSATRSRTRPPRHPRQRPLLPPTFLQRPPTIAREDP